VAAHGMAAQRLAPAHRTASRTLITAWRTRIGAHLCVCVALSEEKHASRAALRHNSSRGARHAMLARNHNAAETRSACRMAAKS